jgi:hypothetical protein
MICVNVEIRCSTMLSGIVDASGIRVGDRPLKLRFVSISGSYDQGIGAPAAFSGPAAGIPTMRIRSQLLMEALAGWACSLLTPDLTVPPQVPDFVNATFSAIV